MMLSRTFRPTNSTCGGRLQPIGVAAAILGNTVWCGHPPVKVRNTDQPCCLPDVPAGVLGFVSEAEVPIELVDSTLLGGAAVGSAVDEPITWIQIPVAAKNQ